jgi:hypothetical protein
MANPGPASSIQTHPQVLSSNQALRLLGSAQSINCNATGDTAIPILNTSSYIILYVIATNASISPRRLAACLPALRLVALHW